MLRNGEPWFVATDVCRVLKIDRSKGLDKLGPSEKVVSDTSLKRGSPPVLINEAGLYHIVMRCDKPDARPFQDWVTKTVLPTIRKEGVYVQGEEKVATATNLNELESLQEQMLALMARKETILTAKLQEAEERLKVVERSREGRGAMQGPPSHRHVSGGKYQEHEGQRSVSGPDCSGAWYCPIWRLPPP